MRNLLFSLRGSVLNPLQKSGAKRSIIFPMALLLLMVVGFSFAQQTSQNQQKPLTSPPVTPPPSGSALAPPGGGEGEQYDFEFSGVYAWGDVISSLCSEGWCRTQLPRAFYEMSVPLNVYEKDFDLAFKALAMQALADGYILKKTGKKKPFTVSAELDEEKQASYISCLDTTVKKVPVLDLVRYKFADSLKCVSRAFLADSLARARDSLYYPSKRFRVSFYVVSSSFVRSLGVDWTKIWATGDLFNMPDLITDWSLQAVANNDTTAEFRSVEVDLDSLATLHWGSQKKEETSLVVHDNGVTQNSFEWRNYGLTLTLKRDKKTGLRADYQLAQRDENNSVLRGNFGGGGSDSISAFGVYDTYQTSVSGVPWFSSLPLVGRLFLTEHVDKVKSFFVIRVFPTVLNVPSKVVQDSIKSVEVPIYEGVQDSSKKDSLP